MEPLERLEFKENREIREHKERREIKGQLDLKETQELTESVFKESKELVVLMEPRDLKET